MSMWEGMEGWLGGDCPGDSASVLTCWRSSGLQTLPSRCGQGSQHRSYSQCRWRPAKGVSQAKMMSHQ